MATKGRGTTLSPVLEQLRGRHAREVAELRERYGDTDPAELLAVFVRDTFPLEALIRARDKIGKGNDPDDDWNGEAIERDGNV